jgi:hypothetical protein
MSSISNRQQVAAQRAALQPPQPLAQQARLPQLLLVMAKLLQSLNPQIPGTSSTSSKQLLLLAAQHLAIARQA